MGCLDMGLITRKEETWKSSLLLAHSIKIQAHELVRLMAMTVFKKGEVCGSTKCIYSGKSCYFHMS